MEPGPEMMAPSEGGRRFELEMRPGLADCAPSGRMRLDALARWLQDVAFADVEDAGLADAAVWVVRRNRIHVARFPRFAEHFTVETFCSGIGRMWAERRTSITRQGQATADVEAVAVILCAELNVVLRRKMWPRSLLTPFTDNVELTGADKRAYTSYAKAERAKGFEQIDVQYDDNDATQGPGPTPRRTSRRAR